MISTLCDWGLVPFLIQLANINFLKKETHRWNVPGREKVKRGLRQVVSWVQLYNPEYLRKSIGTQEEVSPGQKILTESK